MKKPIAQNVYTPHKYPEPSVYFLRRVHDLPREYAYLFVFHLSNNNSLHLQELVKSVPTIGVISIPYSEQAEVKKIISKYTKVFSPKLDDISRLIKDICRKNSKKKIIIMEIGGYSVLVADQISNVVLSVEDTERGHDRFIRHQKKLTYPVVSIARTAGKHMEDAAVGHAIVQSLVSLVDDASGTALMDSTVLVLGYGGIGRSVVGAIQGLVKKVVAYDVDPKIKKMVSKKGLASLSRVKALNRSDIIIGCAGQQSVSLNDIRHLKNNALLASGSSRQVEFPYQIMTKYRTKIFKGLPLEQYAYKGKTFLIAYRGQPINFYYDISLGNVFDVPMTLMVESVLYGLSKSLKNKLYALPKKIDRAAVARAKI